MAMQPDLPALHAVVLAAGASERFGSPKALATYGGLTLLERAIAEVSAVVTAPGRVMVVVGAHGERLAPQARAQGAHVVWCPEWRGGMVASLQAAVREAAARGASALLVSAVDQPTATRVHFASMCAMHREGATLVASGYEGAMGIPVLFGAAHFAELQALPEGARGKEVLAAHRGQPHAAVVALAAGGLDVDTPADLARLPPPEVRS